MCRRTLNIVSITIIIVMITVGCSITSAEDMYALPQLSEQDLRLQDAIDEILNSGAEYASPSSGSNRQAIQFVDLDGDGTGEVLAFFSFLGSDKPLKIYIFRNTGDGYTEAARIEGEGSGIDNINYIDMNNDGAKEIAVGWQIASGINILSVYTMKDYEYAPILNTDYTEYIVCDINSDNRNDIAVLRLSTSELSGEIMYYALEQDGEMVYTASRLSTGVEALLRVRTAELLSGSNAVLIESKLSGGGIITDIFAFRDNSLVNITMNDIKGLSEDTLRTYEVYCRDIDGDGCLDVPRPVELPTASETTTYYMIEWYSYYLSGRTQIVARTYNNYTDGWYMVLPDEWVNRIAVRRVDGASGERVIAFSILNDDGTIGDDFLFIYTLTGENRFERASYSGRFILTRKDETVFAASIVDTSSAVMELEITQELVRGSFNIIYSEWITGET